MHKRTYKEELEITRTALDAKQVNSRIQQGKFSLEDTFTFVQIWNKIKALSRAFVVTDTNTGEFWVEVYDLKAMKPVLGK